MFTIHVFIHLKYLSHTHHAKAIVIQVFWKGYFGLQCITFSFIQARLLQLKVTNLFTQTRYDINDSHYLNYLSWMAMPISCCDKLGFLVSKNFFNNIRVSQPFLCRSQTFSPLNHSQRDNVSVSFYEARIHHVLSSFFKTTITAPGFYTLFTVYPLLSLSGHAKLCSFMC